ncbi:hypothetical protein LJR231_001567 [Phyllobacterium sp. LjRoot231]|uniref:hypothetical protein n=1 Tax=Phyllobacterium sp. LjRoot231 TaxID=3342289 RepID=UPI003ECD1415
MAMKLANNATTLLAANITSGATTLTVTSIDADKFPVLSAGDWFPATIIPNTGAIEIVRVTGRAGAVFTITRAQEGTTARAFNAGSRVDLRLTSGSTASFAQVGDDAKLLASQTRNIGEQINAAGPALDPPDDGDLIAGVLAGVATLFTMTWANLVAWLGLLFVKKAGDTMAGGLGFGSVVATTANDLSKHLALYGAAFGFNVTSGTLNHNSSATHDFYAGATRVGRFNTTGLNVSASIVAGTSIAATTSISSGTTMTAGGRIQGNTDIVSAGIVYAGNGLASMQTNGDITGSVWAPWGSASAITAINAQIEARGNAYMNAAIANIMPTVAAQGAGAVGSYVFAKCSAAGVIGAGTAGTTLVPAGLITTGGSSMGAGSYRAMGDFSGTAGAGRTTLFLRFA